MSNWWKTSSRNIKENHTSTYKNYPVKDITDVKWLMIMIFYISPGKIKFGKDKIK